MGDRGRREQELEQKWVIWDWEGWGLQVVFLPPRLPCPLLFPFLASFLLLLHLTAQPGSHSHLPEIPGPISSFANNESGDCSHHPWNRNNDPEGLLCCRLRCGPSPLRGKASSGLQGGDETGRWGRGRTKQVAESGCVGQDAGGCCPWAGTGHLPVSGVQLASSYFLYLHASVSPSH